MKLLATKRGIADVVGALALSTALVVGAFGNNAGVDPRPAPVVPPTPTTASGTDGEEGIGSLPSVYAPTPTTPSGLLPDRMLGPYGLLRPFVVLSGNIDDIDTVVSKAEGDGIATVIGQDDGTFSVGLHGVIEVEIDPVEAAARDIELGFRVGPEFGGGTVVITADGFQSPPIKIADKTLPVRFIDLFESGALDGEGVQLMFTSLLGTKAMLEIDLSSGFLRLSQSTR